MRGVFYGILYNIICVNIIVTIVCNSFLITKSNSNVFISKSNKLNYVNSNFYKDVYNIVKLSKTFNVKDSLNEDSTIDIRSSIANDNRGIGVRSKRIGIIDEEPGDNLVEDNLEYYKLNDYMGSCFLQYALSIILGRALPDARDGLKVVHRRILWAMHVLKLGPSGQFRKCAKVVGDVLGNYHPHSDKSVYDALCRLCQDFVMKMPLIDGHGNFGSSDDPPAAMRYTECRLTPFSKSLLLDDINLNTVDLVPNFDNTHVEPLVLPCRIPNLLINGSSGIAVGLATNIPPHNPEEIIRAAMHLSKNNGVLGDEDELLEYVHGPDFPTGGTIKTTKENFKKIYKTGRGTLLLQSKFTFEEKVKGHTREVVNVYDDYNEIKFKIGSRISIVVTEIPYNIKISDVIVNINKNIRSSNLVGISDVRDESDRNGTRLVIDLKKQISSTIEISEIIEKLNNLTELSHYFKCNFIALDKNGTKPVRFNLFNSLSIWLNFRISVLKRKFNHLLKQTKYYLNITNGYLIIIRNLQPIIQLIKSYSLRNDRSADGEVSGSGDTRKVVESGIGVGASERDNERELYTRLSELYGLNDVQIKYAMKMTLRQLSRLNEETLKSKKEKLESEITDYKKLVSDDKLIYKEIANDLEEILDSVKLNERKTQIQITDGVLRQPLVPDVNIASKDSNGVSDGEVENSRSNSNGDNGDGNGSKVIYDEIDNLVIYNDMGYLGKIKLDNRFYKSNKNKSIRTKLLFSPNTSILNTNEENSDAKSKEKDGKGGESKVQEKDDYEKSLEMNSQDKGDDKSRDKDGDTGGKFEKINYCSSNNNNNLIVVTNSKVYNIRNSKLKLCKRGYNLFKFLRLKPHDQRLLYLTNYKPPLKDILLVGFSDGLMSVYNNTNNIINKNGSRLKLKLFNIKDRIIKFFVHTSPEEINNKRLFICTKMGNCVKVNIGDIIGKFLRDKRKRKNLKVVKLRESDEVSSFCLTEDNQQILILTNIGKCKLINSNDIKLQKTKGIGYKILRSSSKKKGDTERVSTCLNIDPSSSKRNVLLITKKGVLCKKQLNIKPSPKHHKTKKFWSNIPVNDELIYSNLL